MADRAELQSLLERVERATGPDRELDADIDVGLLGGETIWAQANYTMEPYPASKRPSKHHVGGFAKEHVPLVTASIDAALALVERMLPGKHCRLGIGYVGDYSSADLGKAGRLCRWSCDGFAERPDNELPLAILAALLRALIAQADADLSPR